MIQDSSGELMTDEKARELFRETIRRCGRFIMASRIQPVMGEVQVWAGMRLRVTGYVTYEENEKDVALCADLWGWDEREPDDFYFTVEVAD